MIKCPLCVTSQGGIQTSGQLAPSSAQLQPLKPRSGKPAAHEVALLSPCTKVPPEPRETFHCWTSLLSSRSRGDTGACLK